MKNFLIYIFVLCCISEIHASPIDLRKFESMLDSEEISLVLSKIPPGVFIDSFDVNPHEKGIECIKYSMNAKLVRSELIQLMKLLQNSILISEKSRDLGIYGDFEMSFISKSQQIRIGFNSWASAVRVRDKWHEIDRASMHEVYGMLYRIIDTNWQSLLPAKPD